MHVSNDGGARADHGGFPHDYSILERRICTDQRLFAHPDESCQNRSRADVSARADVAVVLHDRVRVDYCREVDARMGLNHGTRSDKDTPGEPRRGADPGSCVNDGRKLEAIPKQFFSPPQPGFVGADAECDAAGSRSFSIQRLPPADLDRPGIGHRR